MGCPTRRLQNLRGALYQFVMDPLFALILRAHARVESGNVMK